MSAHVILDVAALRELEARAGGAAEPSLMERAGAAAAAQALAMLGERPGCVLVLAGPGNNGGDGYVMARHLLNAGREVLVATVMSPDRLVGEAKAAYHAWLAAGGSVVRDFVGCQWVLAVDALLGIGATRAVEGRLAEWIGRLNQLSCPVLALDLPSGIEADSGQVLGCAVRATHTASFLALKPGLLTLDGPDHAGEIVNHDLGVDLPANGLGVGELLTAASLAAALKPRRRNSHKGTYGEVGILGGAPGMLGAALLAGRAALHLGAGRVYLGLLDSHAPAVDLSQPELMLRAPGDLHLLSKVLAVGPGLGMGEAAQVQLRRALGHTGPLVLDADALNLIAEHASLQAALAQREGDSIVTPHPAEAARLLHCATSAVQADRVAAARELARLLRAHVVLKGAGSVIADPDGNWAINASGNPALATAGSGDVLCGFVAALLAQGWPPALALRGAVHLHGAAADRLVEEGTGPVGVTAGELIPPARHLLNRWIAEQGAKPA